jgi:hypothetical protein
MTMLAVDWDGGREKEEDGAVAEMGWGNIVRGEQDGAVDMMAAGFFSGVSRI